MYLNKVMLYGNLTSDPELKSLPTGNKVISFSIATNRSYKDQNEAKKEMHRSDLPHQMKTANKSLLILDSN